MDHRQHRRELEREYVSCLALSGLLGRWMQRDRQSGRENEAERSANRNVSSDKGNQPSYTYIPSNCSARCNTSQKRRTQESTRLENGTSQGSDLPLKFATSPPQQVHSAVRGSTRRLSYPNSENLHVQHTQPLLRSGYHSDHSTPPPSIVSARSVRLRSLSSTESSHSLPPHDRKGSLPALTFLRRFLRILRSATPNHSPSASPAPHNSFSVNGGGVDPVQTDEPATLDRDPIRRVESPFSTDRASLASSYFYRATFPPSHFSRETNEDFDSLFIVGEETPQSPRPSALISLLPTVATPNPVAVTAAASKSRVTFLQDEAPTPLFSARSSIVIKPRRRISSTFSPTSQSPRPMSPPPLPGRRHSFTSLSSLTQPVRSKPIRRRNSAPLLTQHLSSQPSTIRRQPIPQQSFSGSNRTSPVPWDEGATTASVKSFSMASVLSGRPRSLAPSTSTSLLTLYPTSTFSVAHIATLQRTAAAAQEPAPQPNVSPHPPLPSGSLVVCQAQVAHRQRHPPTIDGISVRTALSFGEASAVDSMSVRSR
ncbi:hypothetical protein BJ742DRAFT_848503 [Cladochytrium replicatum]|nr:hypothetical protein BJ742DRAFT_848503 [Cladochytrium replicatum]